MVKFNDDDKKELSQNVSGFFTEGVYPVLIEDVSGGVTDKGGEYFEFDVTDQDGREGSVRTYFTEAAKPYSFNTIRNIFVHNTPEKNQDKIREALDACADTDDLLKKCESLRGKEAWLLVQKNGTTYISKSGKVYENLNRNLYGYEPKFTPSNSTSEPVAVDLSDSEEITTENVEQVFPFAAN